MYGEGNLNLISNFHFGVERERESTKKAIFSESFINGFSDLGLEATLDHRFQGWHIYIDCLLLI